MPDDEALRRSAPPPQLAAIVCTRNRADLLRLALEGLANQTLDRAAYEVIVVDDGSTDDTRLVAEGFSSRLPLRYVYQRNAGLASAKNLGLFSTLSPLVLFLDDDDVAAPELLEQHVRTHRRFAEDRYAVLGCTVLAAELATDPLMHFVTEVGCFLFSYPNLRDGDVLDYAHFWGGRTSCKRSFLLSHGVFNPVFRFGCEDIELGFRLSRHGLGVVYNAGAASTMVRRVTFDGFCERLVRQGRSNFVFSSLHADETVQRWTDVAGADEAWRAIAPGFDAIVGSARRLDMMAARKRESGFELDEEETRWLHRGYWSAFRAAKMKGIEEGRRRHLEGRAPSTGRPAVSVVIPCFNQARFLGEAIESVVSQGYRPLDVLVVDDGSTDETPLVARRYDVRYVRQENAGLAAARNTGIRDTSGGFLVFLDADDRLLPGAIGVGCEQLVQHPDWAFVSGEHRYIDIDGAVVAQWSGPRPAGDHFRHLLRKNYIGSIASVMFRRAVFGEVGPFDERLGACEDYDLYLRIARRFPVGAHEQLVTEYRRYGSSMSGDPAAMLGTVLRVLKTQREAVRGDPGLEAAFNEGISFWRGYYGVPLAARVRRDLRERGHRVEAMRGLVHLLRHAPGVWFRGTVPDADPERV